MAAGAGLPVDQDKPSNSSVTHTFEKPGLYVFTCKVHPYMFGTVTQTEGLDFGAELQLITGAKITSDIAKNFSAPSSSRPRPHFGATTVSPTGRSSCPSCRSTSAAK